MSDKLNDIARLEKAISERWGEETIQNPKADWSEDKEKKYLEQIKDLTEKTNQNKRAEEKVEIDGVFVSSKLIKKSKSSRSCPVCKIYSFDKKDDVYMNKYECCFKCYLAWVEDREERWMKGWRPSEQERTRQSDSK